MLKKCDMKKFGERKKCEGELKYNKEKDCWICQKCGEPYSAFDLW